MFDEKRILITGGTGTVGQELVRAILRTWEPEEIVIYSRSEISQVKMAESIRSPRITFVIGDIRDPEAITEACRGINYVFHLAALKHIGFCETQPLEAIKTNIQGSINVIKAAIKANVERVVNMSTDKAVNPNSIYGNTKATVEKLFRWASRSGTDFMTVRSGNIIGSSGSVVPLLISQIKERNEVYVTDIRMTRYFCTTSDIVDFLSLIMRKGISGYNYIMDQRVSFSLKDLVSVLIEKYGNSETKIRFLESRPGEKIHEEIFSQNEIVYTIDQTGETTRVLPSSESSADVVVDTALLKHYV